MPNQLIFISRGATPKPPFDSLSVPLHSVLSTKFEQPTFGSNYLKLTIKPAPDGGLTEGTEGELRFKERPMFEFVALLEKTRERGDSGERGVYASLGGGVGACSIASSAGGGLRARRLRNGRRRLLPVDDDVAVRSRK